MDLYKETIENFELFLIIVKLSMPSIFVSSVENALSANQCNLMICFMYATAKQKKENKKASFSYGLLLQL